MSIITDAISGVQERVLEGIKTSQQKSIEQLQSWTEKAPEWTRPKQSRIAQFEENLDLSLGFAQRVAKAQYEFATALLSAVEPRSEAPAKKS